jgi:membrane peptidoglycan carboxypeptidase
MLVVSVPTLIAGAGILLGAALAPGAQLASEMARTVDQELLSFPSLGDIVKPPAERSVVSAADGSVLAVFREVNRKVVGLGEIPEQVRDAVIATEDTRFWTHSGVSWEAVGRAALGNLQAGEIRSGASTITQQLVKNLTGADDVTLRRKLQEAVWATQLERRISKEQILELYLNEAYFGNGVYGIATAAEYYFGKQIGEVSVDEAALLAGLIRSPGQNDPITHPDAAVERRNIVLNQMAEAGYLSGEQAAALSAQPLVLQLSPLRDDANPFLAAYIHNLLLAEPKLGPDPQARERLLLTGGLEIHTTLSPLLQRIADTAIREVLTDRSGPQASLVAIDPKTGAVLAIGSGPRDFGRGPGLTEVLQAVPGLGSRYGRQPGSAFKAFEVVAALESGVSPAFTTDTPSPYIPTGVCARLDPDWQPSNYSDGGSGVLDMAGAVAKSSNVYFARLVDQFTGPGKLIEVARRMGITQSDIQPHCAAVLGSEDVYPIDMASAFGTLADDGTHCEPYAVAEVRDRDGNVLLTGGGKCSQAVDPGIARRATDLLTGPIRAGTASRNGQIGRPAAGKTGTTSDYRDAWFAGYIPQLSAATWVGYEQPAPMYDERCSGGRVTGGCLPTMIWQRFMTGAIAALALPVEGFGAPPPVQSTEMPDVLGVTVEQAVTALREAGFFPVAETVAGSQPPGTVIGQPDAGVSSANGAQVTLRVSGGKAERSPPEEHAGARKRTVNRKVPRLQPDPRPQPRKDR